MRRYRVEVHAERADERCLLGIHFLDAANLKEACKRARAEYWDEEWTRLGYRACLDAQPVADDLAATWPELPQIAEILEQVATLLRLQQGANAGLAQRLVRLEETQESHSEAICRLLEGIEGGER